jgi:hypothetical protein
VNFSGETGEFFGETFSQKAFFVTRFSALSIGKTRTGAITCFMGTLTFFMLVLTGLAEYHDKNHVNISFDLNKNMVKIINPSQRMILYNGFIVGVG